MIYFNLSGRVGLSNSFYRCEEKVVIRQKYKDTNMILFLYDCCPAVNICILVG